MILDTLIKTDDQVRDLVLNKRNLNENLLITYLNQNCFNVYKNHLDYAKIIDNQFNTYADGFGIYLALQLFKYKNLKRFNASDLNEEIIHLLNRERERIFIVGGNLKDKQISEAAKDGMNICGYQNGYFGKDSEGQIIQKIKSKNPDVIFIGMGVPKQEFFAVKLSLEVEGKLIICVGNFFEFYFQNIKRIPKLLRNIGIEWLFRLITEPKRLWKRYILGIPQFTFYIFKEFFNRRIRRSNSD
jgi:N-acetylglucosaminyldiphosphoundecaprenol N-acetyl-beta-D-mannosaminyltransferase